jgi:mRNA interferase RelE/StbE
MYKILIENSAKKDFDNLNQKELHRVALKINQLKDEPRPYGTVKLKNSDNDYRIRIGDYRVVYEINDDLKTITVFRVKHRKNVYKN